MSRSDTSFFIFHKRTLLALIFLCAFSLTIVYAAPRTESYAPGDTLDPDCAPGEDNCSVEIPTGGGSSPITIENTTSLFSTGLTGTGVGSDAQHAIFLGEDAGGGATGASFSNFLGRYAGKDAIGAYNTNFLGYGAGQGAENTYNSNFFGIYAGTGATDAFNANFFGYLAGQDATNASDTNFFGANAGDGATDAYDSNFFGNNSGYGANNAANSNFFGSNAGYNADNADNSNFLGDFAGADAIGAANSNFFGSFAGYGADGASLSNLFGFNAGKSFTDNSIGSNNIIIGTNISLPNTTANAINIGGVLFGTGTYSTTTGNPSITPVSGGRIGIGVVSPAYTLDVNGAAQVSGNLIIGGTCTGCLPSQTSNSGKYLTTDGTTASWATVAGGSLPSQTGNAGKFLTTNGTIASWGSTVAINTTDYSVYTGALGSPSVINSVFLGYAGLGATNATSSNFIGSAGNSATNASYSNFMGSIAGDSATNASYSNFVGFYAGADAVNASYSNFIGHSAGYTATNAVNSNFFGQNAGNGASAASYSNLFGYQAGKAFTSNNIGANNIIIGTNISLPNATANALNIGGVLFGTGTYSTTTGTPSIAAISGGRIGIGVVSPVSTLDVNGDLMVSGSNRYINFSATSGTSGYGFFDNGGTLQYKNNGGSWANITTSPITVVNTSSLFSTGLSGTGSGATPINSIFLGVSAGSAATSATISNFFGLNAGSGATSATKSNFFGANAGLNASSASDSNFLGINSGSTATNASFSNFFGNRAGYQATNAFESNFFGQNAGNGASAASYSNLFGYQVGKAFTSNNIGSNNIIIGTNISLPDATANAINIGGVLFGTGTSNTGLTDPSITPVSGGRIGIGVVSPSYTLQVGNSGVSGIVARFENSAGTCDINPTSASLSCSSDETLKKDIIAVDDDMLEKILSLQPVTYHWKSEDESSDTHIGFIAQQVEEVFPDLVTTDRQTGLKSLNYTGLIPYTVKAVQELDLKVADINTLPGADEESTFADKLTAWLANASNHITRIFTGEVCLTDSDGSSECLNKAELTQLKALLNGSSSSGPSTPSEPEPAPEEPTDPVVIEPIEETPPEVLPEETPEAPSEPSEPISEVQS